MSKYSVGDRIITPAKKLGEVSSVHSKKITIVWENGLSAEYTPKQLQAWNYQKFLEEGAIAECNSHNLTSAQELVQAHLDLVGTAEIDEYCSNILERRYPKTHNYRDVQSLAKCATGEYLRGHFRGKLRKNPKIIHSRVTRLISTNS